MKNLTLGVALSAILLATANTAVAQTSGEQVIDEVIVTGSRMELPCMTPVMFVEVIVLPARIVQAWCVL